MYLQIIKRDLKRKKAMNAILLIFIMLSSMFVSSSVSNMGAINGAVDDFFEKTGMPDLIVNTMGHSDQEPLSVTLDSMENVISYEQQPVLVVSTDDFRINGSEPLKKSSTYSFQSFEDTPLTIFDGNNHPIEEVQPGTVLVAAGLDDTLSIEVGDTLELNFGGHHKAFTMAGFFKDASGGGIMVCKDDLTPFLEFKSDVTFYDLSLYYVHTNDPAAVKDRLSNHLDVISVLDQTMMKSNYILDMVMAGILLVVSICLILVAFVMLRFTISFTLSEEYQQIGVLKAIGIPNLSIRGLYLSKYALLSVFGAALGFLGSIPFGKLLLESVSKTIVMEDDAGLLTNILCSTGVVAVTLLFCYSCTRKVKRFTPVDAIRSGTTGERFKKKGILKLSKMPSRPAFFMAVNDVLSSPKRFSIVVLIFTLCLSLILMLVNSVNTLRSDTLIHAFGMTKTDLYMVKDVDRMLEFFHNDGRQRAEVYLEDMEETLAENGIESRCSMEIMMTMLLSHGDTEYKTVVFQGIGNHADQYDYYEGTAPRYSNEVAITSITADVLGVQIGDTITAKLPDGDQSFIITALYQSMMYMGEGVHLHEDANISFRHLTGISATQIDFNEEPENLQDRKEQVNVLLDADEIYTAAEFVDEMAATADTLEGIQMLTLGVSIIIIALVTVLMEKSFITKERSEIATMKALGISNGTILAWHTLRFGLVALIATGLSMALTVPLTKLCIDPVFGIMGASFGVEYEIDPCQVYGIYPALVLVVTMLFATLTAVSTRSIQPRECTGND